MSMKVYFSAGLLAAIAMPAVARAVLVAGDSYVIGANGAAGEYDAASLNNSTAHSDLVTPGFVNGHYGSGSGTANFTATASGLQNATVGATSAGSGKVNWIGAGADNVNRSVARNLSPAAPASGSYYVSHLVNRGNVNTLDPEAFVGTGFGNAVFPNLTTTSELAGLFVGFAQDGVANNFGNLVIRSRNTTSTTAANDTVLVNGATTSTLGITYLVVMKINVNVSGGQDQVTWWLDPTNASSDATLSATATSTGTFSSFALQGSTDWLRLNYAARDWNGTAFFDEPRLSTDLAGLGLAVPEPASAGVIVASGLSLLVRRRRR